ncbi:unnamed protein product [Arctogadus glacialis]
MVRARRYQSGLLRVLVEPLTAQPTRGRAEMSSYARDPAANPPGMGVIIDRIRTHYLRPLAHCCSLHPSPSTRPGAVLLVSVQGIAANVDPVVCTWLLHQPHRTGSRQQQQAPAVVAMAMPLAKRREDEVSVGSTPLAKQPSNQASDYASSPVKTKTVTESRPLSIPMKVMPISTAVESWSTSEERMKALIAHAWDAVKRLTLQLEVQSCCVFLPNDSLPSPSTIICGDIPGTVRSWYHNQASMPGTLVVCLPQISVLSAGHKYMEPLQELPFVVSKPILEEGDAFPWTISLSQFSVYTLLGQQHSLSLLEPMGCTSTLAVTSHRPQASEGRQSFVVCLHVDLQPVQVKCSNPQVQLLYELFLSWSTTWARLQKHSVLRQTSGAPETPQGAALTSPVRSSAGTVLPDASTCSPSADLGSPTESKYCCAILGEFQAAISVFPCALGSTQVFSFVWEACFRAGKLSLALCFFLFPCLRSHKIVFAVGEMMVEVEMVVVEEVVVEVEMVQEEEVKELMEVVVMVEMVQEVEMMVEEEMVVVSAVGTPLGPE